MPLDRDVHDEGKDHGVGAGVGEPRGEQSARAESQCAEDQAVDGGQRHADRAVGVAVQVEYAEGQRLGEHRGPVAEDARQVLLDYPAEGVTDCPAPRFSVYLLCECSGDLRVLMEV